MSNFAPAEAKDIKLQWHRNEVKMKTENSRTAFWNAPFDSSLDTESDFGQCRVVRLDNKKHGHICTGPWWLVGWVWLYVHRNRRLIRNGEPRTSTSTFTQLLSSGPWWKHGQLFVAGVAHTGDFFDLRFLLLGRSAVIMITLQASLSVTLPPSCAIIGYADEEPFLISACLSTDAVSALWKALGNKTAEAT